MAIVLRRQVKEVVRLSRIDVASLSHSLPVKPVSASHMLSRVVRAGS
jgi:hypothetical protein